MLPVPLQEMRMRPICRPQRRQRMAALVDHRPHAIRIVDLARNRDRSGSITYSGSQSAECSPE